MLLPQSFYNRSTLKVARDLLGCFLVRRLGSKIIKTIITETEAYHGPRDLASHASRGRTSRNEVMFGPPGIIYVYFTYGMHYMLNIVTGPCDYPAAVLIRGLTPVEVGGRFLNLAGPARLTKALKIDKSFNKLPVFTKKHGLWLEARKKEVKSTQIKRAKRIGIDYAGPYRDKKWRFILEL
jgi:DNA-3-methyladenine glycosylase